MYSQLRRGESIAAPHLARLEAGHEPTLALLGAAVREGIRNDIALCLALQGIVADRCRGAQRRLNVSRLDERRLALTAQILILVARPDAGEAIGLQLDLHLDAVRLRAAAAGGALRLLRLGQDAEQVLHVVADLVCDHVGLRELAGFAADVAAAEARRDLIEERGVEIDLLVHRTIERPHRALRDPAAI